MIIAVALCNYFSFHHPYLVVLLGTGASAQGQAFGVFLVVGHSFVLAVSPQPGFKVGPDLAAVERGKGKKKKDSIKKKKMLSRKLLSQYHSAQPIRHKEKSPHSRAACSTG